MRDVNLDCWVMEVVEECVKDALALLAKRVCKDVLEKDIVDEAWIDIEKNNVKRDRQKNVDALRLHWRQKREELNIWRMVTMLDKLTVRDVDKEVEVIDYMVSKLCMEDNMAGTLTLVDEDVLMEPDMKVTTLCREVLEEIIVEAVTRSREMVSVGILNEEVVDKAWATVEYHRILKEVEYMNLSSRLEKHLREARELVEAEKALFLEQELREKRRKRIQELKEMWAVRKKEKEVSEMIDMLRELSLDELAKDVEELECMIATMRIEGENDYHQAWWEEELDVLTSQEETLVGGMEVMIEVPDMDTSMEHEDEDMVVEVSHENEEPPSHGDMISPVHEPPTLPEKGWEEVIVLGGHVTVRDEVEMNMEKSG